MESLNPTQDFEVINRYPKTPLRILVSGSKGLVGSALTAFLKAAGHSVFRLVRNREEFIEETVYWNPQLGDFQVKDFENFDAVIHLAGKNIAGGRWTQKNKEEFFLSRCRDSWLLSQILLRLSHPPRTVLCASAIGIYGDRGEETLTEKSCPGKGFLADLCRKWENATSGIEQQGTRGVHTRFGVILSPKGGMLKRILPLFRLGLGAVLGSGKQYVSWVALEDVIYASYHILMTPDLKGPVNITAPFCETNQSFSKKLAKALHRPLFLRIGQKPLHLALGEVAEEMLLASAKVLPEKLQESNYDFYLPTLEAVLSRIREPENRQQPNP